MTVLIVEDNAGIRRVIRRNLSRAVTAVWECSDGLGALAAFQEYRPDVVLMDIQMPGMDGVDTMNAIRSEFPGSRFIVLTTYQGDVQALRAIRAGAAGYLLKNMLRKDLLDTIRVVNNGKRVIPPAIAANLAEHLADDALSDREIDVLRSVAAGNSNKLIAEQLSISEATVKGHMKSILSKLGANDRTHAVTIALNRGFIQT